MAWLARASKNVRCLAVMILGRMSSLAMARLLLAAVERSVPNRRRRKYLKASFGCLTAKNLQHILQCHDLGQDCSCPDLAGPGAQRGMMHLLGRSRRAVSVLTWHRRTWTWLARRCSHAFACCFRICVGDQERHSGLVGIVGWQSACRPARRCETLQGLLHAHKALRHSYNMLQPQ